MSPDPDPRILDALYSGISEPAAFNLALQLITEKFRCRSGTFLAVDVQSPGTNLIVTNGVIGEASKLYVEQFAAIDPAPALFARLPVGTASTTDRIMTRDERAACIFLQEFFRPIGLTETLGGHLFSDRARFSLIGLQRGDERTEFTDDDIAVMERLMPHIARTLQVRRAFARLEAKVTGLQATLDRLEAGVLMLGAEGEALFVNGALRRFACRQDGLALDRAGRLLPANLEARRRLDALISGLADGGAGGIVRVPRASGELPYAVLVAPLPSRLAAESGLGDVRPGALILVHDPAARSLTPAEILQKGLGLPPGAARLVAALAAAENLQSFAEREGITIHTVRYHLRTALARTDTRSQSDLVRLAVRLLRDFGLEREGEGLS
jgi:hypothetical protein